MVLHGIDVASYQQGIGISSMTADFVIAKATEGTTYLNPAFADQVKQTLDSGKLLGVYHFASGGNAQSEADYFLSQVGAYVGKAVLVLDFEGPAVSQGVAWAKQWLDYVKAKAGVVPMIYMGLADENRLDWSSVASTYGLWVAQYNNYNVVNGYQPRDMYGSTKSWPDPAIFQYTSVGRLPGWGGNLDLNVFYGDRAAWAAYAGQGADPLPVPASNVSVSAPKVNVSYGLHLLGGGWLDEVTNFGSGDSGFAGLPNHQHDLLYIKVDHGSVKYRVHTVKSGWLPWVTKGNRNDTVNGCAGIAGEAIDGVQIVFLTPAGESYQQAYYRSQTTQRKGWLDVVCDDGTSLPQYTDTYAGMFGESLDRLQIGISSVSLF